MRLNVGHFMWLGAGQAAAWRSPSRIAVSFRINCRSEMGRIADMLQICENDAIDPCRTWPVAAC
jgi:hypothetical protein